MSEDGTQPLLILAILGVALLSLIWQFWRAWRGRFQPHSLTDIGFWIGATAWVFLGFLLRDPHLRLDLAPGWRWLLPVGGLLGTALLRWVATEIPRLQAEEPTALAELQTNGRESDNGAAEEGDLDAEDVRLLQRLMSLLTRRARDLMVPAHQVPCITELDGLEQVTELLTGDGITRIPVLDRTRTRAVSVIDGRDVLPHLYGSTAHPGGGGLLRVPWRELSKPLPTVPAREPAERALETLRSSPGGMAAVTNPLGHVIGFLAWQPIFRSLLGRSSREGGL